VRQVAPHGVDHGIGGLRVDPWPIGQGGAGVDNVEKQRDPSDEASDQLARKRMEVEHLRLETEINALRGGLHPWWRQGRTVTALVALIAAILPITTGIQGLIERQRERDAANITKLAEARDKYLEIVLKEPKSAQLVLRYLLAISEDAKIREWAETEQKYVNNATGSESREKLYKEAVAVVAKLAHGADAETEKQFMTLYEQDLLLVESPEVEALMVRARRVLDACKGALSECDRKELQNIAYQLRRQTRDELIRDAIAQPR